MRITKNGGGLAHQTTLGGGGVRKSLMVVVSAHHTRPPDRERRQKGDGVEWRATCQEGEEVPSPVQREGAKRWTIEGPPGPVARNRSTQCQAAAPVWAVGLGKWWG